MSEVDAAGTMIAGTMVARAIDPPPEKAGELQQACPNCGAAINGAFCANCGQSARLPRSIGHIFHDLVHGLLHFDSRGWRTLPMLLFRPGRLTREYVEGKRARYVAPFAMFLFTVLVLYVVFAVVAPIEVNVDDQQLTPAAIAELEADLVREKAELAELEAKLAALRASSDREPGDTGGLAGEIGASKITIAVIEKTLARARQQPEPSASGGEAAPPDAIGGIAATPLPEVLKTLATEPDLVTIDGAPQLEAKVRAAFKNPDLFFYRMQQSAYKFSFLLVPLSLPFVWLLFPFRREAHLYDHVVFTLYSLSFMTLLFVAAALLARVGLVSGETAVALSMLIPPFHMFAQLKGAYRLSVAGALVRTAALSIFSIVVLSLYFVIVAFLGVI